MAHDTTVVRSIEAGEYLALKDSSLDADWRSLDSGHRQPPVNAGHAHEGRTLRVVGRQKRPDMLELRVELPDGSRLHVLAAWTDLAGASQTTSDVAVSRR